MAVSTVKLNGTTLMTVNDTTAEASDVAAGEYFYAADGTKTLGTKSGGGAVMSVNSQTGDVTIALSATVSGEVLTLGISASSI